ncbi:putative chloroquine-resistance transporter [Lupinus albus]|uniref:Putative chloroquine-resistance transporter n=1 Tax=Lupinus albus TaxID=3870 RepID=A0A6A4PQM3_LUPAL|nr:putative chloroquine-resistance transporter [Lupinus albus]
MGTCSISLSFLSFPFPSLQFTHLKNTRTRTRTSHCQPLLLPMSSFSSNSSPLPLHLPLKSRITHIIRSSTSDTSDTNVLLLTSLITVTLAIANRVLYKLALVPMKNYPFFLAQFTTFGYVAVYFTILYLRYCARIVTNDMLSIPKSPFLAIGFLEALGVASGMSAAAILPGPVIPILSQTFLVWQLMFSTLFLGRRYSINQLAGCLLVAAGVVVAIASGSNAGHMLSKVELFWPALMIVSGAFQAGASVIKEYVFVDSAIRLKNKSLDIFVVNSFGSGFQWDKSLAVVVGILLFGVLLYYACTGCTTPVLDLKY